jgi:hypothetical protein
VAQRVSPTSAIRAQIDELFSSGRDLGAVLEEVGRLTVRLMMQQAIEAEVDAFLGRQRYERRDENTPAGYRGHQPPVAVKTTMGAVELARPKPANRRDRRAGTAAAHEHRRVPRPSLAPTRSAAGYDGR